MCIYKLTIQFRNTWTLGPSTACTCTRYNCKRHPLDSKWLLNMFQKLFRVFSQFVESGCLQRAFNNASLEWFCKVCGYKLFVSLYSVHFFIFTIFILFLGNCDADVDLAQIFVYIYIYIYIYVCTLFM